MSKSEKLKQQIRDYKKRKAAEDPTFFIGKHIKKSARSRKLDNPHTAGEYKSWFKNQKQECYYCGHNLNTANNFLNNIAFYFLK